ncbi:uncharacterized protein LOC114283868 [Camellia sinensis]|uniref:uncharacterized protein LOC114283868 n=1 Tax=Camellia sinensis TaxID=4442 RepID=UPI001035E708|nr:uncharacterized protein LOC114283868 [Camellia sinensis]
MLSWNVHGLRRGEKRRRIKSLIKEKEVDMVLLQETKLAAILLDMVRSLWYRDQVEFMEVDASSLAGGILCIWDPSVFSLSACCSNKSFILLSSSLSRNFECVIINIYAPNDVSCRATFWDSLCNLKSEFPKPWCLGGDFNKIKNVEEHKACSRRDRGMQDFNNFISKLEVSDLPMLGRQFTWSNSQDEARWSRLDRFMFNPEWLFINAWLLHPLFLPLVKKTWLEAEAHGWVGFVLWKKLKILKEVIRKWNVEVYGNLTLNIKKAEEELHVLDLAVETRILDDFEI